MNKFIRDIDYDGSGGYYSITTTDDSYEAAVKKLCPKAFMKRTVNDQYVYQIRKKTGWFSSEPIGDTHYWKDQAWESAYKSLMKIKDINIENYIQ